MTITDPPPGRSALRDLAARLDEALIEREVYMVLHAAEAWVDARSVPAEHSAIHLSVENNLIVAVRKYRASVKGAM